MNCFYEYYRTYYANNYTIIYFIYLLYFLTFSVFTIVYINKLLSLR